MLLAQASDGGTAALVVIGGLVGSALTALFGELRKRRAELEVSKEKDRRGRREDESITIGQYERLMARIDDDRQKCIEEKRELQDKIDSDRADYDKKINDLREELRAIERKYYRRVVWVRQAEQKLAEAGIAFKRMPDSDAFDTPDPALSAGPVVQPADRQPRPDGGASDG